MPDSGRTGICNAPAFDQDASDPMLCAFVQATFDYRTHFIRVVQRITGSYNDAEDIVQIAFMKAFANLPRFRGDAKMSTWLRTIVHNAALEYVRSHGKRTVLSFEFTSKETGELQSFDIADSKSNPEEHCMRSELAEMVEQEVGRLGSFSKRAIQMCFLQEDSQAEAAEALGVSISSVKSRVLRGKRRLHRAMCSRIGTLG